MTEWVEPIPPEPPPESSFRVGLSHQHTDEFPPLENATESQENSIAVEIHQQQQS